MTIIKNIIQESLLLDIPGNKLSFGIQLGNNISLLKDYSIIVCLNEIPYFDNLNEYDVYFEPESEKILYIDYFFGNYNLNSELKIDLYLVDQNKNIIEKKTYNYDQQSIQRRQFYESNVNIQQIINSIEYSSNDIFYFEELRNNATKFSVNENEFLPDLKIVLDNLLTTGRDFVNKFIIDENIREQFYQIYKTNVSIQYGLDNTRTRIEYPTSNSFLKQMLKIKERIQENFTFKLENVSFFHEKTISIEDYENNSLKIEHEQLVREVELSISNLSNETKLSIYEKNGSLRIKLIIDNKSELYVKSNGISIYTDEFISETIDMSGDFSSVEDDYTYQFSFDENLLSSFNDSQEVYYFDTNEENIYSPSYFSRIRDILNNPTRRSKIRFRIQLQSEDGSILIVSGSPDIEVNFNLTNNIISRNLITNHSHILRDESSIVFDMISLISSNISRDLNYSDEFVISSNEILIEKNLKLLSNSFVNIHIIDEGISYNRIIMLRDCNLVLEGNQAIYQLPQQYQGIESIEVFALNKFEYDFESICNSISSSVKQIDFSTTEYLANSILSSQDKTDHDYFSFVFDII
jgi:hypothetical protein